MKKKIIFGFLFVMLVLVIIFWRNFDLQKRVVVENEKKQQEEKPLQEDTEIEKQDKTENETERRIVDKPDGNQQKKQSEVPFTSQAPLGNWKDQHFQNGCEEASAMMAAHWVKNEPITSPAGTEKEMLDISKFEEKKFGNYIDASLDEVGQILSEYYRFKGFSIRHNIVSDDMKKELALGNILLVPAFGQALKNPYFTSPGPITHMLVVKQYDPATKNFTTNDPGTKRGENFKYDENVLFSAIWEYPSGNEHPPVPQLNEMKKGMIVINPN